jgi:hypothetical protein
MYIDDIIYSTTNLITISYLCTCDVYDLYLLMNFLLFTLLHKLCSGLIDPVILLLP